MKVLLVLLFGVHAMAFPTEENKIAMKKSCKEAKVLFSLVDEKAKECPEGIKEIKEGARDTRPIVCVLSNKTHAKMTPECYKAAKDIYDALPFFIRPDVKGL